ncbi:MAG: response regulator transcription factor [Bacteroidales bacterium]|jgi:DNA-binding NarL/FixJ family response regulator|nr:response regulator transcription factor [Bacteroidales bacterium]
MINVLLVDDHKVLADGLKKLFEESGDIKITSIANNAKECRYHLRYGLPDVLILDINLPDENGITLCKELISQYPVLKILALTTYYEYSIVRKMLENGALGYVTKNAMTEELILGIRRVALGEKFLCHEIDIMMKKQVLVNIWLTPREKEILRLIIDGFSSAEIAEKTSLGVETIKGYRKNLLLKLGAKNTAILVKTALEKKLIW